MARLITFILLFFAFSLKAQEKTVVILNSKNIFTEEHKWNVRSVELKDDCTIVEKYVSPMDDKPTWIASDQNEFIEDAATGKRYYIIGSDIGFEKYKVVLHNEFRTFKEVYPPLPKSVYHINISTGEKYFVKYVDLRSNFSPVKPPVSAISFLGLSLGTDYKTFIKTLSNKGFDVFYKEEVESSWEGKNQKTYLSGVNDGYHMVIELTTDLKHNVVSRVEVLFTNHIDTYEVDEHLQEIADEVKFKYPFRRFEEWPISMYNRASILIMKGGKNRIFKNVTTKELDGVYRLYESDNSGTKEFYGSIGIEVHYDGLNQDYIIKVSYYDLILSTFLRRSAGEFNW